VAAAPSYSSWQRTLVILGSLVVVVASLYWAQRILVPIALAVLIAFVLQPVVAALQRRGLRRTFAVLLTVCLAFSVLAGLAWFITASVQNLTADWPQYRVNVARKLEHLGGPTLGEIQQTVQDLVVTIVRWAILPAVEVLFDAVFVIVLVIFILVQREDLRNRLLRLIGHDRRTAVTTKAVDEATHRISRYLLMQLVVNACVGLVIGTGLFVFGVPYAPLWGFLVSVLRFVPYVGVWVALAAPALLSVALSPETREWMQPLEVLGLFAAVELVTANVIEPLVFGKSAGISPVALLVAAIFWTWLWGPIGLVLSTPLTVCLFVLGRYVPQLEFFEVLLGEEPALEPRYSYYQRLLAHDQDEATEVVEEFLQQHPLEQVADKILVPALVLTRRDHGRGVLDEDDEQFILRCTCDLVDDLGSLGDVLARPAPATSSEKPNGPPKETEQSRVRVLAFAGSDEVDDLAVYIFQQLLRPDGAVIEGASARMLTSEIVALVGREHAKIVLIGTLPPGGLAQTRYLCKRLRARFPALKIVVGRWGLEENVEGVRERLLAAGADHVVTTQLETRNQVVPLIQTLTHTPETAHA
jgi:predicted PurR-regulated permease PerM